MTIAVTGGAGFIGTKLCRRLQVQEADFKILDTKLSEAFPDKSEVLDVCDAEALRKALKGCSLIYHLAAEHRDDVQPPSRYHQVNVEGAKNVVAAAEEHGIREIIFTSTVAVYGLNSGESQETDTPKPFNEYGRSKLAAEKTFEEWAHGNKTNRLTTIRLVATFGIGNRGNIYNLIRQIIAGRFMMVGSGHNKKSLAYVKNAAAFLNHCRTLKTKEQVSIFNYADKPDYEMNRLVRDIYQLSGKTLPKIRIPYIIGVLAGLAFDSLSAISGKRFPISLVRIRKFCAGTVVNADKAHKSGFKAPFTLKEGLQHTIDDELRK